MKISYGKLKVASKIPKLEWKNGNEKVFYFQLE